MADMHFRRVTAEDYADVVAIRENIYDGMDYLPALFHSLLETHEGFVAVINAKVVAFQFVSIYDGGTTILPRAGRISREYEGQGVFNKLDGYVMEQYRGDTNIVRKGYSFGTPRLMKKVNEGNATFVLKRMNYCTKMNISRIKDVLNCSETKQQTINQLVRQSLNHLLETMTSNMKLKLFPEERLVMDWVPYRLVNPNLDLLFRDYSLLLQSEIVTGNEPMLTVGTYYRCGDVLRYNIDIHGSDVVLFQDHVYCHLTKAVKQGIENVVLNLYCQDIFDCSKLKCMFDKFGAIRALPSEEVPLFCIEEPLVRKPASSE